MGGWIDGGGSGSGYFPLIGLYDTDSSNLLKLDWNEDSASDRNLTFKVGAADREITLSGSPTLGDWFDQSVKAAATPSFAGLTLTAFSGVLKATAGTVAGGAAASDIGLGSVENTALSTWPGTVNVTTLGTIGTGTWNATAIGATKGGTGQTTYAIGDLLYASAADAVSKLADVATGQVLTSGGVGAAPAYSASPTLTTSLTVPTITLGSVAANGILNLYGLHANGYYSIIQGSNAEGLVGADLRIGLDETLRMLIVCDRGDIGADFWYAAESQPTIVVADAAAGGYYCKIAHNAITSLSSAGSFIVTGGGTLYLRGKASDLAIGNWVSIDSGVGAEITDDNAQQSWIYIEPKVNQSATAAFDALYVNPTLTALGSGATGDGNNLFRLGVAGTTRYKVATTGVVGHAPTDNAGTPVVPTTAVKFFAHNKSLADMAFITLPAVTTHGFGIAIAGTAEQYTQFFTDDNGDVVLVNNTANVNANADTDANLNIGTAAAQEPLIVKNNLNATKVVTVLFWFD